MVEEKGPEKKNGDCGKGNHGNGWTRRTGEVVFIPGPKWQKQGNKLAKDFGVKTIGIENVT